MLGVDALGFVFYEPSPRYVSPQAAAAIIGALPPFVTAVGLFVNADAKHVEEVTERTGIAMVQYHGDEAPDACDLAPRPWIKAIAMKGDTDLRVEAARYSGARGLLLDRHDPVRFGGTGQTFQWRALPEGLSMPVIVAGGLNVGNVRAAIEAIQPWGVDVSGGIETAKGIKDPVKMREFVREVRSFERHR